VELVNGGPFILTATQSLDKDGRPWLVVIAKATYRIPNNPDAFPTLAEAPREFIIADEFDGEPGLSSPLFESDFAPVKAACDVIIKGSAHVPDGKPITELGIGFAIGPIRKRIRVVGDRRWVRQLGLYSPGAAEPFTTLPITYSLAFGGLFDHHAIGSSNPADFLAHPANLVGVGFARGKFLKLLEDSAVPNLEAPEAAIQDPEMLYTPMSFGPIARNWTPRLPYAGTYNQYWQDEIFPLPPPDFDERFYQCAPPDQQMPYPQGGEEVRLLNLRPGGGLTCFRLPALDLPIVVLPKSRSPVALTPVADTLVIDTDADTFDIVWRARMPLKRGLHEIHTVAAGSVCKRWWKSKVYGTDDCGCGGLETSDEDLAPVTEALS
jgi:hypothetical protein